MARRRMIDPSFWQSENVSRLIITQRLMFIGLFSNADDQGRLKAHPLLIRSAIFPFDVDMPPERVQVDLNAIAKGNFIILYAVNSKKYLQVKNWWKYQWHKHARPSDCPAPPGWKDKLHYHIGGGRWISENWDRPPCITWLTKLRKKIMKRDHHTCRYCGAKAEHVDHVVPRVQGGSDKPENLVAACAPCNLSKGGRTPEQAGMELTNA